MKLFLLAALFIGTAVVASPVDSENAVDVDPGKDVAAVDPKQDVAPDAVNYDVNNAATDEGVEDTHVVEDETVDVSQLMKDLARLYASASDIIQQVEVTLSTLDALVPHSIKKRQTTVDGNINRGPGGATGRIDVNHRRGGTIYNGNISRGPGGTDWGVGVSHKSPNTDFGATYNRGPGGSNFGAEVFHRSGKNNFGANFNRNRGGTDFGASYGRTWNGGRTKLGVNVGRHSRGGLSAGIGFSHTFPG